MSTANSFSPFVSGLAASVEEGEVGVDVLQVVARQILGHREVLGLVEEQPLRDLGEVLHAADFSKWFRKSAAVLRGVGLRSPRL